MEQFGDWLIRTSETQPLALLALGLLAMWWYSQRNAQRDDQNVNAAITLTTTIVALFQPLVDKIERLDQSAQAAPLERKAILDTLETKTAEMKTVTERRDKEQATARNVDRERHEEILLRLDRNETKLNELARRITTETDEGMMRGQMAKMLLLITEISRDTKQLINGMTAKSTAGQEPEPSGESGEHTPPATDGNQESVDKTADAGEQSHD